MVSGSKNKVALVYFRLRVLVYTDAVIPRLGPYGTCLPRIDRGRMPSSASFSTLSFYSLFIPTKDQSFSKKSFFFISVCHCRLTQLTLTWRKNTE